MSDHIAPCTAELEQNRLMTLNRLAERDPKVWYPGENGMCLYCGFRPKRGNLCTECEARRQFLASRYPNVRIERESPKPHSARGMTKLSAIDRPAWNPHNSE